MFKWAVDLITYKLTSYVYHGLQAIIDSGEYDRALKNSHFLCVKKPNVLPPKVYKAKALIGLERFEEANSVCEEAISIGLTKGQRFKSWHSALFEQKCRALWALQKYVGLEQFCDECCTQIPGDAKLLSYKLSSQVKLGKLRKDSEVVAKLISVVHEIQAPWQFVDLIESLRDLGELGKAKSVLQIARKKFPTIQEITEILI